MDLQHELRGVVLHDGPGSCPRDLRVAHLWLCDLVDESLDREAMSVLSTEERLRARRFRRTEDQRTFVAGHVVVRRVLAGILQQPPETLEFRTGRCGKPYLIARNDHAFEATATLDFSVSHSGNLLGLAVAWGRAVGLDLEVVRPVSDAVGIAAMKFPLAPLMGPARARPADREMAFYRQWTETEAITKMQGRGLDCRHAREPPVVLRWTVESFTLEHDRDRVVGAVALETPPRLGTGGAADAPTPSALPWPWAGARYSRTSGSAWPAARSARSTACRSF